MHDSTNTDWGETTTTQKKSNKKLSPGQAFMEERFLKALEIPSKKEAKKTNKENHAKKEK